MTTPQPSNQLPEESPHFNTSSWPAPRPPRDAEWDAKAAAARARERALPWIMEGTDKVGPMGSTDLIQMLFSHEYATRHAPADSASAQLTALTAERDAAQAEVGRLNDYLATRKLVEMFPGTFAALDDVAVRYVATLRQERDELRAELLTTHQMACRVGLERDELAKLLGEAADELAVPGYDAPPISKGVQNLLSRIRAALQSLRALTEHSGKPQ